MATRSPSSRATEPRSRPGFTVSTPPRRGRTLAPEPNSKPRRSPSTRPERSAHATPTATVARWPRSSYRMANRSIALSSTVAMPGGIAAARRQTGTWRTWRPPPRHPAVKLPRFRIQTLMIVVAVVAARHGGGDRTTFARVEHARARSLPIDRETSEERHGKRSLASIDFRLLSQSTAVSSNLSAQYI